MSATIPTTDQTGTSALAKANGGYTFLNSSGAPVALVNPVTGTSYANGVIPFNDPSVSSFVKGVLAALLGPQHRGLRVQFRIPAGRYH